MGKTWGRFSCLGRHGEDMGTVLLSWDLEDMGTCVLRYGDMGKDAI
ncbi:MAG: hypothetical protein Q7J78_00910 [Clostridiales bacterium]|nr:hypothetical protein [Clostridiales bacterium]